MEFELLMLLAFEKKALKLCSLHFITVQARKNSKFNKVLNFAIRELKHIHYAAAYCDHLTHVFQSLCARLCSLSGCNAILDGLVFALIMRICDESFFSVIIFWVGFRLRSCFSSCTSESKTWRRKCR